MKRKTEIVGILILITLSVSLFLFNNKEVNELDKDGVFVLGKLISSTSEGEMSWVYRYEYYFNGNGYSRSFTGPVKAEILRDSLMFFYILPESPSTCRQISDVRVPVCLGLNDVPKYGWKELPANNICDSIKHNNQRP